MANYHRRFVCGVLGGLLGAVALVLLLVTVQTQRYEQAQTRWNNRAPSHYHLDMTLRGDEVSGQLRAEVRHRTLISVVDRATGQEVNETTLRALGRVLPVERLFERVADAYRSSGRWDQDLVRRSAGFARAFGWLGLRSAPGCWQASVEQVAYDATWGYPRHLRWSSNRCDDGMFSLDRFDLEITGMHPVSE